MGKIHNFVRHNKLYVALAVFILLINLLSMAGHRAEEARQAEVAATEEVAAEEVQEEPEEQEAELFGDEDIAARQQKIKDLAVENPLLYIFIGLVNLAILFVIFLGFIFDGCFLVRFFKKEPLNIRLEQQETPRWGLGDVMRVILIFLASGYAFIIIQAFISKEFPILYNENFRMIFNTAMMNIVGISVILYFVVTKYGQKIKAIGLTSKGFSKSVYYAIVGYVCLVPVLFCIMVITYFVTHLLRYEPPVQPIVEVFMKEKETIVLLMSTLFAAIFGPIAEEIFFRGFMYGAVKKSFGVFWGMVVTASIFAVLHAHAVGFFPIMALGLLLAYLYEKTGSLVPSMAVHIIHNVGMVVLVFLMRGIGT
ncbi:MAG: type II CAAX endopeptidase family protein [Candidatus Omnitrophota bacterium]